MAYHQPALRLFTQRLIQVQMKKTSKLRITEFYEGNSTVTGEFPAQRASNVENVFVWWYHNSSQTILVKWGPDVLWWRNSLDHLSIITGLLYELRNGSSYSGNLSWSQASAAHLHIRHPEIKSTGARSWMSCSDLIGCKGSSPTIAVRETCPIYANVELSRFFSRFL